MKKPIRIFLGDLTYDTISLSTESFPLNIGFIASYCKSKFGSDVEIKLFKYIDKLQDSLISSPPDILALSNYCWNQNIGLEMFKMVKKLKSQCITVFGGPNFPMDLPSQEKFLKNNPQIDIYVPIEGETGFTNIVERVLAQDVSDINKDLLLSSPLDGCVYLETDKKLKFNNSVLRLKELDEIPSPYLTGLMDKFFDGKLAPMLQTNRGCPFSCTFCTDGSDEVRQVTRFSTSRVKEEINYIAEHVPEITHSMIISDLNFGMMPRDLEICEEISAIQKKYNYPQFINCTTGKNNKEKIINAIKSLKGSLRILISVQSMDEEVLANIKRDNISLDHMLALAPTIKESNLRTTSEVIVGLPGESYQSHIKTIKDLVKAEMDDIQVYTCMILPGSQLAIPKELEKWKLKTKFRILPRDFVKLKNGKIILETEEVVVASNTMTFEEYVELRLLAFTLYVTNIGIVYDATLKFLRENDIDVFELFFQMVKQRNVAPSSIQKVFESFKQKTIEELWDSPDDIYSHYQDEGEYEKLLSGEDGINVMQYHHALVIVNHMDEWNDYVFGIAENLLKKNRKFDSKSVSSQFLEVSNYCRGLSQNVLGKNRMSEKPQFSFNYDIEKWITDSKNSSLNDFRSLRECYISFELTEEQYKVIQDNLDIYGTNPVGLAQAIKYIPVEMLWRRPRIMEQKLTT